MEIYFLIADVGLTAFVLACLICYAGYRLESGIKESRAEIQADIQANRRVLDELDAKLELIEKMVKNPRIVLPPGNVKIEAVRKVPVYDYESSQRATLEEFKEQ